MVGKRHGDTHTHTHPNSGNISEREQPPQKKEKEENRPVSGFKLDMQKMVQKNHLFQFIQRKKSKSINFYLY